MSVIILFIFIAIIPDGTSIVGGVSIVWRNHLIKILLFHEPSGYKFPEPFDVENMVDSLVENVYSVATGCNKQ